MSEIRIDCADCNGSGKLPFMFGSKIDCPTCNGTGQLVFKPVNPPEEKRPG